MDESSPRDDVANQRAIIDRRAIDGELRTLAEAHKGPAEKLRPVAIEKLKAVLAAGRTEIRRRFELKPGAADSANGAQTVRAGAFLIDKKKQA